MRLFYVYFALDEYADEGKTFLKQVFIGVSVLKATIALQDHSLLSSLHIAWYTLGVSLHFCTTGRHNFWGG